MSQLEWFPADWVDEVCPPARSAPDGFIVPVLGGFELGYPSGEDRDMHNQPLAVGDVIEFVSCERLPDVEVTFRPDGSYDPVSYTHLDVYKRQVLGGFELGYPSGEDRDMHNQPLAVGDVIEFVSCERLPDVEVTFRPDGSYDLHGAIPPGHNVVIVDGDIDTLQQSFDELVSDIREPKDPGFSARAMIFPDGEPEKRVTLEFANWSDPQSFLFQVVDDKPAFSPVPAQKH